MRDKESELFQECVDLLKNRHSLEKDNIPPKCMYILLIDLHSQTRGKSCTPSMRLLHSLNQYIH